MNELPFLCHRCGKELKAGRGELYLIKIEALADPTPPTLTEEDLQRDVASEINRLIEALGDLSDQEALDQVYRRITLYLCTACYREWIENPAG